MVSVGMQDPCSTEVNRGGSTAIRRHLHLILGAVAMETRQSTHPSPRQLAAFALDKLTPDARDRLQTHLSSCASCQAFLSQTPQETLNSLLQHSDPPRINADQATPSARRAHATNPAVVVPPPAGASSGSEPSRHVVSAPDSGSEESIPLELRQQTKYRIVRLLGRGGMGSVYEVHHERMDRREALKVINPELVDNPQVLLRFEQELKAVAKLDHPNIARAYDAEGFGSLQVIVMEFVPGQTLYELLKKRGRLTIRDACRCVRQACLGLQHAHERGLVHRDLKPQNLMLAQQSGIIKILDFGLAKVVSENKAAQGLTKANMTMGTYEYSAPEQALDAASADIRADIYSLGCTIYYLIAGILPFDYDSDAKLLLAHQNETPRPLLEVRPETPKELSDLVVRMLAKKPAERPQTPAEVAKALLPFTKGETTAPTAQTGLSTGTSPRFLRKHWLAVAGCATLLFVGICAAMSIVLVRDKHSNVNASLRVSQVPVEEQGAKRETATVFRFDDQAFADKYWAWNDDWTFTKDGGHGAKNHSGHNSFLCTRHRYLGDLTIDMDFGLGASKFVNTGECLITLWGKKLRIRDKKEFHTFQAQVHIHSQGNEIVFTLNGQEQRIPVEREALLRGTIIDIRWRERTSQFRLIEIKAQSMEPADMTRPTPSSRGSK